MTLTARVASPHGAFISQAELLALLQVSDQTLRNWRAKGLPAEGSRARPRYPMPAAMIWGYCYKAQRSLRREGEGTGLTLEDAMQWWVTRQYQDAVARGNATRYYAIVPLEWNDAGRASALALAARGRPADEFDVRED